IVHEVFNSAILGVGIDSSTEMLNKAQGNSSSIQWRLGDIDNFYGVYDLVFSNAALQWIDQHEKLIPRLINSTAKVLAIQMPNSYNYPLHLLLRETIEENSGWRDRLLTQLREPPLLTKEKYFDLACDKMTYVDIWEAEYIHQLSGNNAVLNWVRGTALLPIAKVLASEELAEFEAAYSAKLLRAYPPRADGSTLLPFRRIFMVATR
ncbi:MAG: trans-aconitate 2-methyltransferase, partial [Burkholderiales bacterium]